MRLCYNCLDLRLFYYKITRNFFNQTNLQSQQIDWQLKFGYKYVNYQIYSLPKRNHTLNNNFCIQETNFHSSQNAPVDRSVCSHLSTNIYCVVRRFAVSGFFFSFLILSLWNPACSYVFRIFCVRVRFHCENPNSIVVSFQFQ